MEMSLKFLNNIDHMRQMKSLVIAVPSPQEFQYVLQTGTDDCRARTISEEYSDYYQFL